MGSCVGSSLSFSAAYVLAFMHVHAFNDYEMVNDSFWRSLSPFKPTPSTNYGTIKLLPSLRMEFDFIFYDRIDYSHWQNIFRIGYKSMNFSCYGYGSRYPSLWLTPNVDHLHLSVSEEDNCHYGPWPNYPIERNKWYSIVIHFNETQILFTVDDHIHINEARPAPTLHTLYHQHMNVWISTDRVPAASYTEDLNATLSNIVIHSWDPSTLITSSPTLEPTYYPSETPTVEPTFSLTGNPTVNPTVVPSAFPTLEPTLLPTLPPTLEPTQLDIDMKPSIKNINERVVPVETDNVTQQSVYFFIIGALLASILCVCMIGFILMISCWFRKRQNRHRAAKQKRSLKNIPSSSRYRVSGASGYNHVRDDDVSSQHICMGMVDNIKIMQEVDVIYEADDAEQKESEATHALYVHVQSEEGAYEQAMMRGEGKQQSNGSGVDKEVLKLINRKPTDEEKFAGMLNDAKAMNDLMLQDVIEDMETSEMHAEADYCSDAPAEKEQKNGHDGN